MLNPFSRRAAVAGHEPRLSSGTLRAIALAQSLDLTRDQKIMDAFLNLVDVLTPVVLRLCEQGGDRGDQAQIEVARILKQKLKDLI